MNIGLIDVVAGCGVMEVKIMTRNETRKHVTASGEVDEIRRENIFTLIRAERSRQDDKWGYPQENTFCEWGCILTEEVGELCKELNERNFGRGDRTRTIEEAIQVAAVAVALIEQYDTAEMVTASLAAWLKIGRAHV